MSYKCLSLIALDSVIRVNKKNKMEHHINDDLDSRSSDESNNESDNEADSESENVTDN